MPLSKRLIAEFLGTLWLVLGGCGSAVLAAGVPEFGIRYAGVALAFGLTVLTGAYALGHISGGHFNPAVSLGVWAAKRFPGSELIPYIAAQVLGGLAGAGIVFAVASGQAGYKIGTLAANGFDVNSPQGYSAAAGFIIEVVLTFFFLIVILGSTARRAAAGFAPLAIGFALTLIHLISIPVTNTSVNPARSTGPAVFVAIFGEGANAMLPVMQLWMFWLAPILGALLAGLVYNFIDGPEAEVEVVETVTVEVIDAAE